MASVAPATRMASGVQSSSKPAAATATTATAASSTAHGSAATAPRSSFARAFDDVLGPGDSMPTAAVSVSPPGEIERRLQTLEDALCSIVWPAKEEQKVAMPAAFDPKLFVRPTRKRQTAPARSTAPPPPSSSEATAAAASTAATPAPVAPVSLSTVAERDRQEAAIISAIRSNNPAPLRALLVEVFTLRQPNSAAAKHTPGAPNSAASPHHSHHSSLPSAPTALDASALITGNSSIDGANPTGTLDRHVSAPAAPKLNGLALLKAKAKAKALEAAEAAHAHQQQAATQMHRDEEKASGAGSGDTMLPHRMSVTTGNEDQHSSHIGRSRDRNPSRSSAAAAASAGASAADHSRSPSGDRIKRPSRHGSFKRRRRRQKRLQNLEGGPYRSRFDEHGALLPGYTSAASGQNTEDEESAPVSVSASHSTLHSPVSAEHAAVLAKASAHVSSLKKKARHARAASMSDASDTERSQAQPQAFETPPKATTGPFSPSAHQQQQQQQQQQPHAKDSAPVFVTAPLLHSTQSSLPQLPHHLLKRNKQPPPHPQHHQSHLPASSHSQLVSPGSSSSSRASLLRAPNFSSHPHSAALASQAGGGLSFHSDPDPMAPNPAVAARLAGLRGGHSHIPGGAGASSWASSGIALPSQGRGGGAASAAGHTHAAAAAAARQFSPSRLQVQFDHSKHRSVPNSIEKQGSSLGQRAPVYAFHGGMHASPNYRVPTG